MKKISFITLALLFILMNSMEAQAGELHDAARKGDIVKVRQLLEQGTDVNARDQDQRTPLCIAAYYGKTDVAKLLIEKGADVNAKDKYQRTPLWMAAWEGNTDVAELLIEKGADVNAKNNNQVTPLHWAAIFGKTDVAKLLIEKGADVNAKDSDQRTPLHNAASSGKTDVAKLLIERGADVNAKNIGQMTPLHWAASNGKTDVAKLLIEKGADVNAKDNQNYTPAVVAEKRNYPELAAMIRKQGGTERQDFDALVQRVMSSGVDINDLQTIVNMARMLTPPPAVPQEARDEMVKGMAAFKLAKRPEDFAEAEAHFSKASHLAPWLPAPYFNLALAQEKLALARGQQNKFFDAKSSFEKYLIAATDPKDTQEGKQKMAELDLLIKRYQEFRNEADAGVYYYQKGSSIKAIELLRKAIEIYPDHPDADYAYDTLGQVYMNQGDLDAAYKYMQKAFELVPEPSFLNTARYTNMGVVLERRGDRAKACIYYKKGYDNGSKVSCQNYRNGNCP